MMGTLKGGPSRDVGFELGQVVGLSLLVGEMGAFCGNNTDHASHVHSPERGQAKGTQEPWGEGPVVISSQR